MPRYSLADLGPSLIDVATRVATEEGVDPRLVHAVLQQESGGQLHRVSAAGARGPMQLMPSTAAELGVNPDDPEDNIRGGVRYLKQQLDAFGGDLSRALAAYNAGPGAVRTAGGADYPETKKYVQQVLQRAGLGNPPPSPTSGPPPRAAAPQTLGIVEPPRVPRGTSTPAGTGRFTAADLSPTTAELPTSSSSVDGPPPGPPPESPSVWTSLTAGLDPRTRTGRANLAGGVGAFLAGSLTEGVGAVPTFAAITGALGGGMLAAAGEQVVGTAPPSEANVVKGGLTQAAWEASGHAVMWPIKAVGRRVLTPGVAAAARSSLQTIREGLSSQLDTLLTQASAAVRNARATRSLTLLGEREVGIRAQESATETATQAVEQARTAGRTAVRQATVRGQGLREAAAARQSSELARLRTQLTGGPPGPPPADVGQQVGTVLRGPAQSVLEDAGRAVGAAAETGPAVNIASVKDTLRAMADRTFPEALRPESEGVGYMRNLISGASTPEEQQRILAAVADQLGGAADHPLPGVLGKLLTAPDTIAFADAHKFKRLLDEAVNWASPAKKLVQQLTKGIRGTLRTAMSGHEPYDTATRAYESLIPLYRRGLAPQILKQLTEFPEYLVGAVKSSQPTKLAMLKDLLLNHAAKGGGGAEGHAAWDSVRAAWIHKNVAQGPLESLPTRLAALPATFRDLLADDAAGAGVLDRLSQIAVAYQHSLLSGLTTAADTTAMQHFLVQGARDAAAVSIRGAKTSGRNLLRTTARTARESFATVKLGEDARISRLVDDLRAVRSAKAAARAPTPTERAFAASSVARVRKPEQVVSDVLMAATRAPYSVWGNLALLRLVRGPRSADLVTWAAYAPQRTQVLVQLMTSPALGMLTSDMGRTLLGNFYADTEGDAAQHLTAADGRRLTRGVTAGLLQAPGPPRLRTPEDQLLGADSTTTVEGAPPGVEGAPPGPPSTVPPAQLQTAPPGLLPPPPSAF